MIINDKFNKRFDELVDNSEVKFSKCHKVIGITKESFLKAYTFGILPSTCALIRIADYFRVSIDYLLGRSDYKGTIKLVKSNKKIDK